MIKPAITTMILVLLFSPKNEYLKSNNDFQINRQKIIQKPEINDEGKELFIKYCLSCHQADGSGVPGMYPPLQKSDWVNRDKTRLIKILLNGLQGEIEVNGEIYSQFMPKQNNLTDHEIANLLTFVRQNFGNSSSEINEKEVSDTREKNPKSELKKLKY